MSISQVARPMIEDASVTSQSWETRRALRSLTLVDVSSSSTLSSEVQEEKPKIIVDAIELQNEAREQMYNRLKHDIAVDIMICQFENLDKNVFLDNLIKIIEEFR